MPRRSRIIVVCTVAVFLAIGAGYAAMRWLAISFPDETTNVGSYASTLNQWSGSGLVSHFPVSVPPQALKVRFAAYPGFLQGGAYIQVRMQLPASDIRVIEDQLKKSATHVYAGGGFYDDYNKDQMNNWPTTTFRTSDNPKITFEFPTHYTLYVLSAKDRSGGAWIHGETSGAAVSTTIGEVVFWADSW